MARTLLELLEPTEKPRLKLSNCRTTSQTRPDFRVACVPTSCSMIFEFWGKGLKKRNLRSSPLLQFIRHLNQKNELFITRSMVQISVFPSHTMCWNYACGCTPVCTECERLVDSGVVVVGAAGNLGYQSFETKEGTFDGYAAFSITDPGNAGGRHYRRRDAPLLAAHIRRQFFSSRGPTGDGRRKPDLVAPGERIRSPFSCKHRRNGENSTAQHGRAPRERRRSDAYGSIS